MDQNTPGGDWDPTTPEAKADPFAEHKRLRQACPVAHSERWGGFWTLTKYRDIVAASRDWQRFIASPQTVIPASPRKNMLVRLPLQADPPLHTEYRRAMASLFLAYNVERLTPAVRACARDLIAEMVGAGGGDVAAMFTNVFPVRALCVFLGLDDKESTRLRADSDAYVQAILSEDLERAAPLSRRMDEFAVSVVADRRAAPRDKDSDVVTALLGTKVQDRPITDTEVAGMVRTLLIGGHTVTTNFLGSAILYLAEHKALQQALRETPALIASAVEELLRLFSPNQALVKTTTECVHMRDRDIPAYQPVAMLYLSGNRDEEMFEAPDTFKMDRSTPHIAFGAGPHACPAQMFAKMEARVALEELLHATADFSLDGDVELSVWPEYGVRAMRLTLTQAA